MTYRPCSRGSDSARPRKRNLSLIKVSNLANEVDDTDDQGVGALVDSYQQAVVHHTQPRQEGSVAPKSSLQQSVHILLDLHLGVSLSFIEQSWAFWHISYCLKTCVTHCNGTEIRTDMLPLMKHRAFYSIL